EPARMKVTLPGPPRAASDTSADGVSPKPKRAGRWPRLPGRARWLIIVVGLLVVVAVVVRQAAPPSTPTEVIAPPAAPRLIAHGVVQPVSQARVGSLSGGVLLGLSVAIGDTVEAQHELARVRGPGDVEVLTAPFAGTVTGLLAHIGDTLLPGAGVVQ